MTRNEHHEHYHFHQTKGASRPKPKGFIKRTIRALAERFNVPRWMIICGFIFLFFMSVPLAILTFLGASYWVKHPGKLEDRFDTIMEKSRRTFRNMSDPAKYAGASASDVPPEHDGFDFADLKGKFEDLEKRAGKMEEHVSSDEYSLNKEFNDIRKD